MRQKPLVFTAALIAMTLPQADAVERQLELDTVTVVGQKAVPGVVFNIPWQSSEPLRLKAQPPAAVETIQPIERDDYEEWLRLRLGQGAQRLTD